MRFIRPQEIFEVNREATFERVPIGQQGSSMVVLDDFYKRPERVRALAESMPAAAFLDAPGSRNFHDYYDARQDLSLGAGMGSATRTVRLVVRASYRASVDVRPAFLTNVFQLIRAQPKNSANFPHQDMFRDARQARSGGPALARFVALVFLNKPRECRGGTAFFRHRSSGLESVPLEPRSGARAMKAIYDDEANNGRGLTYWHKTYRTHWEKYAMAEMKWNRLVIFPANLFHAAWHESSWFRTYRRITQSFFLRSPS